MNPTPQYVVEVLGRPYRHRGLWWLRVKAGAYGSLQESVIAFSTREAALAVNFGYCFIADPLAVPPGTPEEGEPRGERTPN